MAPCAGKSRAAPGGVRFIDPIGRVCVVHALN